LDGGDVVNFQAGENLAATDGVRTLAVTTLERTGSLRGRAMPIWTHVVLNGFACGAACEVGGGGLQADELKRRYINCFPGFIDE